MPIRTALVGYACIAIVAIALVVTHAPDPIDRAVLDAEFAALRAWWPRPVARDVVLVGIDQESIDRLPEPFALWHPHFSKFLQAVTAGGAAAIALDVMVSARFPDARKYSSVGDFSIAPASTRQAVGALRPAANAAFSDRVAYAAWLEQAELKDEARTYWRALASERPGDTRLEALSRE